MRKSVTIILCFALAFQISAQSNEKQQLVKIFNKAEQCYLMDDYQQLKSCLTDYAKIFNANQYSLGDSIDIYSAYYYKMCGAYYYGLAEDPSNAFKSEQCYKKSLDVFNRRNDVTHALVLHEELAQLYYKMRAYIMVKEQLDSIFN